MFMLVSRRLMIKNSSTNSSASPMKHLEFNRSPKQASSARDINKPRTSRSTLSICGTLYFSGSYSPSTGVPAGSTHSTVTSEDVCRNIRNVKLKLNNFVFQHAFYCQVCHCSLCAMISYKSYDGQGKRTMSFPSRFYSPGLHGSFQAYGGFVSVSRAMNLFA